MNHSFDVGLAIAFKDERLAIFMHHITFWTLSNSANEKNFHDGRYWTYNSIEAFAELFPYWTPKIMRGVIEKCVKNGLLLKGNFNENKYDRTSWYALSDYACKLLNILICPNGKMQVNPPKLLINSICPNGPIKQTERANQKDQTGRPIPDIKPDIKPNRERASVLDNSIFPARKKRVPLSDSFVFDEAVLVKLEETSQRVGLTKEDLLSKFRNIAKSKEKLSADWNSELDTFLINERPAYSVTTVLANKMIAPTAPQKPVQQVYHASFREFGPGHPDWERNREWERKHGFVAKN